MFLITRCKSGAYCLETDLPSYQIIDLDGRPVTFIEGISITELDRLVTLADQHVVDYTFSKLEKMKKEAAQ